MESSSSEEGKLKEDSIHHDRFGSTSEQTQRPLCGGNRHPS